MSETHIELLRVPIWIEHIYTLFIYLYNAYIEQTGARWTKCSYQWYKHHHDNTFRRKDYLPRRQRARRTKCSYQWYKQHHDNTFRRKDYLPRRQRARNEVQLSVIYATSWQHISPKRLPTEATNAICRGVASWNALVSQFRKYQMCNLKGFRLS